MANNINESESSFQKRLVSWCNRNGLLNYKTHGGLAYMKDYQKNSYYPITFKSGFSDILLFEKGTTIFLELKSNIGRLKPEQINNFIKLYDEGFINNIFVVRPKDFETIKTNYKLLGNLQEALLKTLGENNWKKQKLRKNSNKGNE